MTGMTELAMADGTPVVEDAFVLGGNVFGWTADALESFQVLDGFAEGGGRMIDTADVYAAWVRGNTGGESESIIGRWMAARGNRDRMLITTKVGQHPETKGLSRVSIRAGLEASLRRLGTDHIDVYYAHFDDPETPLDETLAALDELVREGKVCRLGASNYSPERLREALDIAESNGWARIEFFQAHYNLVRREKFETRLRPLLLERGVTVLPYYSLAQGFLTGKYRDSDSGSGVRAPAAVRYLDERGKRVLAALDQLAGKYKAPPAAVALAWLRAQPVVGAPVASARTPEQLAELMATMDVELDTDDRALLDAASNWSD